MGESSRQTGSSLPHELEEWLKRSSSAHSPVSLASLGVHTGQGLRTGANNFFYGEQLADGLIVFEKLFPLRKWVIPDDIAIPVIRKQADLASGFVVSEKCTPGRVLDLRQHAMPRDIGFGGSLRLRRMTKFQIVFPRCSQQQSCKILERMTKPNEFGSSQQWPPMFEKVIQRRIFRQGSGICCQILHVATVLTY